MIKKADLEKLSDDFGKLPNVEESISNLSYVVNVASVFYRFAEDLNRRGNPIDIATLEMVEDNIHSHIEAIPRKRRRGGRPPVEEPEWVLKELIRDILDVLATWDFNPMEDESHMEILVFIIINLDEPILQKVFWTRFEDTLMEIGVHSEEQAEEFVEFVCNEYEMRVSRVVYQ